MYRNASRNMQLITLKARLGIAPPKESSFRRDHAHHAIEGVDDVLTPATAVVTSGNASASGLSLEGAEVASNIEAGVLVDDQGTLDAIGDWLNRTVLSDPQTWIVDDEVIATAERIWAYQSRTRIARGQGKDLTILGADALRGRNIWVLNYPDADRSVRGQQEHAKIRRAFQDGSILPPPSADPEIKFEMVDDYEEEAADLKNYQWNSWVVDLLDPASWAETT